MLWFNKFFSQNLKIALSIQFFFQCGHLTNFDFILDSAKHPERFIEERARDHLRQLTSVGPRPAGSYENEVLAVEFIRRQLTKIQKATKSAHNLIIDVQKPRGSFNLQFVDGLTQNYRDITNIVVKLEPSHHRSKDALLGKCPNN